MELADTRAGFELPGRETEKEIEPLLWKEEAHDPE
jgi:hypothetical protein